MRHKQVEITLINDTDYLALAQALAAAGDLVLETAPSQNVVTAQGVTLTSAGNLAGVNFTIYGLDEYGNAQQETLAGPNATTVTSANKYTRVTRIAADAGTGANNIEAGYDGLGQYRLPIDAYAPKVRVAVSIQSGSATWDVEHGYVNPLLPGFDWGDQVWHQDTALTAQTGNVDYFFDAGIWALQFSNTVAGAGVNELIFTIIPEQRLDTGDRW